MFTNSNGQEKLSPKEENKLPQKGFKGEGEIDSRPRVVPHIPIYDKIQIKGKQSQQGAQAKPDANKARNIHDIFQISKECCTFESYESGEGVAELSAEEICKMNQYAKDIRKDSEELDKFIKKIDEVRTRLLIALDNLHPDVLPKYISEGKIEVLKKYVRVVKQYFKITADILYERGKLDDKDKFVCEDSVAKKLKRIEDAENEAQKESGQPQQKAQSADNAPEKGTPTLSPQITPQNKSNVYDNKGFGKEIMSVVGAIVGAIIGATIAYLAGATTLPIIAAIAVISAVPGVLIGYGIAEICEKVSGERKNDPEKGILTALSIVLTPKCMSGSDVAKT